MYMRAGARIALERLGPVFEPRPGSTHQSLPRQDNCHKQILRLACTMRNHRPSLLHNTTAPGSHSRGAPLWSILDSEFLVLPGRPCLAQQLVSCNHMEQVSVRSRSDGRPHYSSGFSRPRIYALHVFKTPGFQETEQWPPATLVSLFP